MYISFNDNKDTVFVKHRGQTIDFITSALYKAQQTQGSGDPFRVINQFINNEMDSVTQDQLFEYYLTAKEIMTSVMTLEQINAKLTKVVSSIMGCINHDVFVNYMHIYSGLIVPSDIKSDWGEVDESFTENKTYLRKDYIDLLDLVVIVRLLIPIWGEYVGLTKDSVPDAYKEYNAYRLLGRSSVSKFPAFERLSRYVTEVFEDISKARDTAVSTVSGIGVEEIPEWIAATLLVRRCTIFPLDAMDGMPPINIITKISAYVESLIKNINKRFSETIRAKSDKPSTGDSEQETSLIEANYRVKQELPYTVILDTIAFLNPYGVAAQSGEEQSDTFDVEAIINAVHSIDSTVPESLILEVIEVCKGLETQEFGEYSMVLTKMTLATAISVSLFDHMDKMTRLAGMICSQSLLHHWGFHELALTVTSVESTSQLDGSRLVLTAKPTEEQMRILDEIYPYGNPMRVRGRAATNNYGAQAIAEFARTLTKNRRKVRLPKSIKPGQVGSDLRGQYLTLGSNITTLLINTIVKLDQLKELELQNV